MFFKVQNVQGKKLYPSTEQQKQLPQPLAAEALGMAR
jgi:hypothetical protein